METQAAFGRFFEHTKMKSACEKKISELNEAFKGNLPIALPLRFQNIYTPLPTLLCRLTRSARMQIMIFRRSGRRLKFFSRSVLSLRLLKAGRQSKTSRSLKSIYSRY